MNSAPGGPSQWNERLALVVVRLLLVEPDGTHRAGWGILGIAQLPCSGFSALSVHCKVKFNRRTLGPRVDNWPARPPPLRVLVSPRAFFFSSFFSILLELIRRLPTQLHTPSTLDPASIAAHPTWWTTRVQRGKPDRAVEEKPRAFAAKRSRV